MLSAQDNRLLTDTAAGTLMGALFRRFWMPVLLSADLPTPGCPPRAISLLGEDHVAFRDASGAVGVLAPRCAHRGAHLADGRCTPAGLRCAFHGWTYDRAGQCVAAPSLPQELATDALMPQLDLGACPAIDSGGLIWAYLGPPQFCPPLPRLEITTLPPEQLAVSRVSLSCNWAQCCESALDAVLAGADGPPAMLTMLPHEAGLVIGAARPEAAGLVQWRIGQFLMPNHVLSPDAGPGETQHGQCWVPLDAGSCIAYRYSWNPDRALTEAERAAHEAPDQPAHAPRIALSQPPIIDRSQEHLGPSDAGIERVRRLLLDAARAMSRNQVHVSAREPEAFRVRAGRVIAPQEHGLAEVMRASFGDIYGRARAGAAQDGDG